MTASLSPTGELKQSLCKLTVTFTQDIFQDGNQTLTDLGWRPLIEKLDWDENYKPLKKQVEWRRIGNNAIETDVTPWKRSTSYKVKVRREFDVVFQFANSHLCQRFQTQLFLFGVRK